MLTPSNRARHLWAVFEPWADSRRAAKDVELRSILQQMDVLWHSTPTSQRESIQKLEDKKAKLKVEYRRDRVAEARREWESRLFNANLGWTDWDDITNTEKLKVLQFLGDEKDERDAEIILKSEDILNVAPPLTSSSRSTSGSTSYDFVNPTMLSKGRGHNYYDDYGDDDGRIEGLNVGEFMDDSAHSAGVSNPWADFDASSSTSSSEFVTWTADTPQSSSHNSPRIASEQLSPGSSYVNIKPPSSSSRSSSKMPYISAPVHSPDENTTLSSSSTTTDEESFKTFTMEIRAMKIREFHTEAAEAEIQLAQEILLVPKNAPKAEVTRMVRTHEERMLALQKTKDEERRKIVAAEREKRRAEIRGRSTVRENGKEKEKKAESSKRERRTTLRQSSRDEDSIARLSESLNALSSATPTGARTTLPPAPSYSTIRGHEFWTSASAAPSASKTSPPASTPKNWPPTAASAPASKNSPPTAAAPAPVTAASRQTSSHEIWRPSGQTQPASSAKPSANPPPQQPMVAKPQQSKSSLKPETKPTPPAPSAPSKEKATAATKSSPPATTAAESSSKRAETTASTSTSTKQELPTQSQGASSSRTTLDQLRPPVAPTPQMWIPPPAVSASSQQQQQHEVWIPSAARARGMSMSASGPQLMEKSKSMPEGKGKGKEKESVRERRASDASIWEMAMARPKEKVQELSPWEIGSGGRVTRAAAAAAAAPLPQTAPKVELTPWQLMTGATAKVSSGTTTAKVAASASQTASSKVPAPQEELSVWETVNGSATAAWGKGPPGAAKATVPAPVATTKPSPPAASTTKSSPPTASTTKPSPPSAATSKAVPPPPASSKSTSTPAKPTATPAKQPAPTPAAKQSAPPPASTKSSKSKNKKNKKKSSAAVTVEEVADEEDVSPDPLPANSRTILELQEPKPSKPPTAFESIFSYEEEEQKNKGPDLSFEEVMNGTGPGVGPRGESGKRVRWTPSVVGGADDELAELLSSSGYVDIVRQQTVEEEEDGDLERLAKEALLRLRS